jgi:hypothetical protein
LADASCETLSANVHELYGYVIVARLARMTGIKPGYPLFGNLLQVHEGGSG